MGPAGGIASATGDGLAALCPGAPRTGLRRTGARGGDHPLAMSLPVRGGATLGATGSAGPVPNGTRRR